MAVLPSAALTLLLLSANWPTYRKLASVGVPAEGVVTSTGCETGGRFAFVFEAEQQTWAGHGRAWRVGMSCASLTPGRQVPVYFVPGSPEDHAATTDPEALSRQELLIVVAFGVASLVAVVLLLWSQGRRGEQ